MRNIRNIPVGTKEAYREGRNYSDGGDKVITNIRSIERVDEETVRVGLGLGFPIEIKIPYESEE
jgi:hypothetical protein